jgi:hypothetical protein
MYKVSCFFVKSMISLEILIIIGSDYNSKRSVLNKLHFEFF